MLVSRITAGQKQKLKSSREQQTAEKWRCTPSIPALRKAEASGSLEFKVTLVCIVRARATQKTTKRNNRSHRRPR